MSVLDNVMIGAFLRHPNTADARAKAREVLEQVGLGRLADAPARSLGTPGRKRLEIARALASEPKVLLLDEAMAGLTPTEVRAAIDLVRQIHATGITLVIVEHIMEVIVSLAERVRGLPPGPGDRPRHAARGDQRPGGHRGLSRPPRGQASGAGDERAASRGRAPGGALRRPDRRRRCLARGGARARSWPCWAPTAPARPRP